MGISLPAPTRSLLSGARHAAPLLLAGATYLVLGSDGLVHRTTGLKLAFWSLPLYGLAALLLASDLMRRFGRGRWAGPIAGLLSWLGYAVVAYGMVSGLASLASEMQRQPGRGAAGEALGPYFDHLAGLAPWIFIYILLEALYRVVWAYRNTPPPGRTSPADSSITDTKGKNHWTSFTRLGERLLDDPLATVRAVRQFGIWLAAIFLFLHTNGYVRLLLGLDLSFLSPPLYGFAGFLLLSNLVRAYGPRPPSGYPDSPDVIGIPMRRDIGGPRPLKESGPSVPARFFWGGTPLLAGLLLWSALSLLAYLLLDNLTRVGTALVSTRGFTHAGEVALPYLVVIGKLDIWVAIFLALIGLYRSSAVYWRQAKYVAYHPMVRAVMMLLLGGMAWAALASLVPMGPMYGALGAVAFSALAAVSLGHLANYTKDQESKPLFASLSQWTAASPLRNANLGAFVAFYSLVIRPTLYATFIYAPLLEWGAVVLLGLYILRGLQGMIEQYHSGPPQQPIWPAFEKHKQVVSTVPDLAFESVLRAQQSFSALGNRSPILAYLVPVLWDHGVPVEQITRTITPLANHTDPVQPTWLWLVGARAQYIPPLKRLSSRFEAGLIQSRVEALRLVQESVESIGGRTSVPGSSPSNGKRVLISSPAKGQISPSPLYQRDGRNPPSHLYQTPLSPDVVRGISETDPWSWAEDAFIETGDRAGLATVVAVSAIGGWQRSSRPPRVGISHPLEELFRYRDAQPRWYHLPGQRQRLAEERQGNRHNLVVYLKSLVTMSYQPRLTTERTENTPHPLPLRTPSDSPVNGGERKEERT